MRGEGSGLYKLYIALIQFSFPHKAYTSFKVAEVGCSTWPNTAEGMSEDVLGTLRDFSFVPLGFVPWGLETIQCSP